MSLVHYSGVYYQSLAHDGVIAANDIDTFGVYFNQRDRDLQGLNKANIRGDGTVKMDRFGLATPAIEDHRWVLRCIELERSLASTSAFDGIVTAVTYPGGELLGCSVDGGRSGRVINRMLPEGWDGDLEISVLNKSNASVYIGMCVGIRLATADELEGCDGSNT